MRGLVYRTAAAVMIIFTFSFTAIHAADLKDGFLGLKWLTDLSASPDFVKIDEQHGVQNFIRPSVIHSVGGIDIFPVIYSSFENEFFAAYFEKDILIFGRLRNLFNEEFGPSTSTTRLNPRRTTDIWYHHDTKVKIDVNRETGELKLSVYYTPLSTKVDEQQLEAQQQNTRRFLDRIDKDRAKEKFDMMNRARW